MKTCIESMSYPLLTSYSNFEQFATESHNKCSLQIGISVGSFQNQHRQRKQINYRLNVPD